MKKILLLVATLFLWSGFAFSQTVLYEDDLESYTVEGFLAQQNPTWWDTWSGAPGGNEDLQIKTTFAHSGTKSALADVTGGTATDAILLLGNRTSGAYELSWWMYIPTGNCGYYNMQHFESPGLEWAYEIYFHDDGSIECLQGGNTLGGSFPFDVFFQVINEVDCDADLVTVTINGTQIGSWPLSDEAQNPGGTKQMGAIDFYAGGATGETPLYYIDDIYFAETTAGAVPIIGVDPASVATWLVGGTTGSSYLTVSNTGTADLEYDINIVYDVDAVKSAPVQTVSDKTYFVKRTLTNATADPTPNPGGAAPSNDATAQLHYDGENASAIGWNTTPVTVTVAARFPNSMTLPYAGMNVTSVELYVNDLNAGNNDMMVKIFGMGNTYEPGNLLFEQAFVPGGGSWETIDLTTPVPVTGEDLWVGYQFTQTDGGIFIPGTDGGPADPNGDFFSTGVGWSHLAPTLDYNWNIRANLVGDPIFQWLTATPMSGTVPPAGTNPTMLAFDATSLDLGTYNAMMKFLSNDNETPVLDVPVTLTVAGVGIEKIDRLGVMTYPNPTKDKLNIVTNGDFKKVTITDYTGKVVFSGTSKLIDVSALSSGVYFIKVETTQGIANSKFVKN